jgi:hypothetical protein
METQTAYLDMLTKDSRSHILKHDFSLVLSKHESYLVIACRDYTRCKDTITIFRARD